MESGGLADLVLSDMAPSTTGHNGTDHLRIMALAEATNSSESYLVAERFRKIAG